MIADQATGSWLLAKIYARLWMRCWQVNLLTRAEAQHWLQYQVDLETNLAIMVRRVAQAQLDNA